MKRTLNLELNKLVAQDKAMRKENSKDASPLRKHLNTVHTVPNEWDDNLGGYVDALARRESDPNAFTAHLIFSCLIPNTVEASNDPANIELVKRINAAVADESDADDYNADLTDGSQPAPPPVANNPKVVNNAEDLRIAELEKEQKDLRIAQLEKENAALRDSVETPAPAETTPSTSL